MPELSYTVSFTTPAFLGNAEQQAQWRTAPFKALLRQWWRVAAAPQFNYDYQRLREAEGKLFGQAHEGDNRKSLVRLRLSQWEMGRLTRIENSGVVFHPEVQHNNGNIEANVYLGFGPVSTRGLAKPPAIEPERQTAEFWLGFPDTHTEKLKDTINLIGWFGTLGSRSRNAWGSLMLQPQNATPELRTLSRGSLQSFMRPINECLLLDWPHAIGSDGQGALVWKAAPKNTWRDAMQELAKVKIAFRAAFPFNAGNGGPFNPRHLLAYPVTNHRLNAWGNDKRLPNQIRFKVAKENNQFIGLISHLPCRLPVELANALGRNVNELQVWQQVHQALDSQPNLTRLQ